MLMWPCYPSKWHRAALRGFLDLWNVQLKCGRALAKNPHEAALLPTALLHSQPSTAVLGHFKSSMSPAMTASFFFFFVQLKRPTSSSDKLRLISTWDRENSNKYTSSFPETNGDLYMKTTPAPSSDTCRTPLGLILSVMRLQPIIRSDNNMKTWCLKEATQRCSQVE